MSGGSQQQGVSLDSLSAQQLTAVKKQLDEEVDHLTTSFAQLQAAQIKFRDCLRCVKTQGATSDKKEVLVPLTNSLYAKGNISRPDRVLVDIGTGFFVEKDTKSAAEFYEGKIKDLSSNIADLEGIVQNKTNTLRAVEEVLKQKLLAAPKPASS
ncbi:Prefoldin alpha subunit [Cryphonectria parasitica EP155]|uniref:Prefoldin alpha subunit n=1 Tax=Cryphonectria parasitica (strain ATCC 38755 / EP155) TaxID=660469 RepID=A0A9P4Y1V4_CRYP1|nr:Prefoldin alpha subunit [Cryphonectria parasitica EP155]KAF3764905.1 Prefoldin alpha subunit [Cryphonectria parasitica EP155]